MTRNLIAIAADIASLDARDFDEMTASIGIARLDLLCDEILTLDDPASSVPILLQIVERFDGEHLGSPGPLVHTLEMFRGRYELPLADSIRRKPTHLTLWMANRILNSNPPDAAFWLELLRGVLQNPSASAGTKAQVRDFIEHQCS